MAPVNMLAALGVFAVMQACGPDRPSLPELSQEFYGRWEGPLHFSCEDMEADVDVSLGLSIDKHAAYLTDLCPRGGGMLKGDGSNRTVEMEGTVSCRPAVIAGCEEVILTWSYAAVLLVDARTTHVTASGRWNGCGHDSPFVAIGDLQRLGE